LTIAKVNSVSEKKSKQTAEESPGVGDSSDPAGIDDQPEVRAAAECVERAREQLRAAQQSYRDLRRQAEEKMETVRGKTVGELIDSFLQSVRKRPVLSLLISGFLGYFLGRLFRR
jgi:molecular chaperone GrpE (heat shock protein)